MYLTRWVKHLYTYSKVIMSKIYLHTETFLLCDNNNINGKKENSRVLFGICTQKGLVAAHTNFSNNAYKQNKKARLNDTI